MFPGPYSTIIRNEAGEPIGWDNNYPEDFEPDEEYYERRYQSLKCEICGQHPEDCDACDVCGKHIEDGDDLCEYEGDHPKEASENDDL